MVRLYRIFPPFCCMTCLLSSAQNAAPNPPAPKPANDYSGMYSFLQDGEFVQLTVEEKGSVTGFISRYGDLDSDRGEFLDLFFKSGKLDGKDLSFTTQTVHGVWYEFKGHRGTGTGKESRRRSLLPAERHSDAKQYRRGQEDLFKIARCKLQIVPAGHGRPSEKHN